MALSPTFNKLHVECCDHQYLSPTNVLPSFKKTVDNHASFNLNNLSSAQRRAIRFMKRAQLCEVEYCTDLAKICGTVALSRLRAARDPKNADDESHMYRNLPVVFKACTGNELSEDGYLTIVNVVRAISNEIIEAPSAQLLTLNDLSSYKAIAAKIVSNYYNLALPYLDV
ncbi:MAG: hypothetical protein P0S95_06380 [Rhabdochlamydiaceae bacterium]|nr:hypothetical protein [Candidatus Amphrikana amoebophyrae]